LRRQDTRTRRPRKRQPSLTADDETSELHAAAVRLLTRREHAAGELAAKLTRRGFDPEAVETEIERLAQAGLQSDRRFAELFAEQRAARGQGPLKIRAELATRGVPEAEAERALAAWSEEWPGIARGVAARRFGAGRPADRREWQRRARFLQGRGFPCEMVARVLDRDDD